MKSVARHKKRVSDYLGTALAHKKLSYFSKKTKIGKARRDSLAGAYKASRKTGRSLDNLRRYGL